MKKLLPSLIYLFVIMSLCGCASKSITTQNTLKKQIKTDILFIAYDYGDAVAFKAVLPQLKLHNIHFQILAFGAAEQVFSDELHTIQLKTLLPQKQQAALVTKWKTSRSELLPALMLKDITSQFTTHIVVTGMAHAIQAQLASQFSQTGSHTIAFYDNFDVPQSQNYVKPWLNTVKGINEVFLPGDYLIDSFLKIASLSRSEITVTGNPALESWANSQEDTDKTKIINELSLSAKKPIAIYAMGYDKSASHWFNRFLDAAMDRPDIQVVVALHPKIRGQLDPLLASRIQKIKNIKISPQNITTEALTGIADLVVTHKSTVGVKAAYVGVPVLYLADETYTNILIDHHFAELASSWSEIINTLHQMLDQTKRSPKSFASLGIPMQSAARFNGRLLEVLKDSKPTVQQPVLEKIELEKNKTQN